MKSQKTIVSLLVLCIVLAFSWMAHSKVVKSDIAKEERIKAKRIEKENSEFNKMEKEVKRIKYEKEVLAYAISLIPKQDRAVILSATQKSFGGRGEDPNGIELILGYAAKTSPETE